MVLPPNRIGGVRGPNGATLDDVVAAVSDLLPVLEGIQSSVAALAQRVDALFLPDPAIVVNGFEWEGIQRALLYQSWLQTNIFTVANEGASAAVTLRGWLGYHLGALDEQGAVQPGGQAAPAKLYLSAIDTAAALTSASGDTAYSRFGTMRDNSTAILQAIGTLPSTPNGETVKTLLAALLECCQTGGGETPGNGQNPAPSGFCDGLTRVRQLSWDELGTTTIGGTAATIYRVQFNFGGGLLDPAQGYLPVGEPNAPQSIRIVDGVAVNLCLSWDFSGQTAPLAFGRDIGAVGSTLVNSQFVGTPLTGAELQTGGDTVLVDRVTNAGDRLVVYNFAFATGVTPTLNVHLGVDDVTPA